MSSKEKKNKVLRIMRRLLRGGSVKDAPLEGTLLERILLYLFFYGGNASAARRALKAFREEYIDLNEVRVTGISEIAHTLEQSGISTSVAILIKTFLRQVFADRSTLNLDFLKDATADQIRRYFLRIEALPQHAVNYIISSVYGATLLPVEGNVLRAARRLGLVEPEADVARGEQVLKRIVLKKRHLDFYLLMLEHAKKICAAKPLCSRCVLQPECAFLSKRK